MTARNVSVIVLYRDGREILLQHRTKDAPTFPDHWAFFGGGIENGESPEQAVTRECLEELGYQLTAPRLLTVNQIVHQGNNYTIHVFVEKYNGGLLTLGEGQGMGWYTAPGAKTLLMNDHDRSIVEALGKILATN